MREVILPLPTNDTVIEYPKISNVSFYHPIGVEDQYERKFLLVKESDPKSDSYCYSLQPINRLNDNYDWSNRFTTNLLLEHIFAQELENGSQIFLFDNWSEFYEWCLV